MGALPQDGEMMSLLADEAQVAGGNCAPTAADVSIAAVNGPASVVISGGGKRCWRLPSNWQREGVKTHRLTVSHAFHSPLMEPMLAEFRAVAESITYHEPQLRWSPT